MMGDRYGASSYVLLYFYFYCVLIDCLEQRDIQVYKFMVLLLAQTRLFWNWC